MSPSALDFLLQTLEERNIDLGKDDIAWAFEEAKTKDEIESWIKQFLTSTCLLTVEERAFLEKQGSKGANDAVTAQPVLDQSFEDAISSLEASTAAIEKQCRLLDSQRQALRAIKRRSRTPNNKDAPYPQVNGKISHEQSQVEYQANELADMLQTAFRTAAKQSESGPNGTQSNVERVLEKDDRLLDGLEKILPNLSSDTDGHSETEEADQLCHALTLLTTADIRARIDAAYLDGMQQASGQANGVNGRAAKEARQLASLNAELDELCREIDGLSNMAVDNQFRNPIIHATGVARSDAEIEKASWMDYLASAIQSSTGRLDYLQEQLEDQRAHASASKAMSAALDEVLAASMEKQDDSQRNARSPVKSMQKGLKPLRLVQANLSDAQDPASQLLRQLDVRAAGELDETSMSKSAAEKADRLASLRTTSERTIVDQIAQSLNLAETDAQQLLGAVFANSQYGTVHLGSDGARSGIEGLESKTQDLGEKMRTFDTEAIIKAARAKQYQLLETSSN